MNVKTRATEALHQAGWTDRRTLVTLGSLIFAIYFAMTSERSIFVFLGIATAVLAAFVLGLETVVSAIKDDN